LRGSGIKVCTPIAFPHGAASTAAKVVEAREAIKNGAEELDVSLNILAIKNGDPAEAKKDLEEVINIAHGRATVKAIYEQGLYTDEEKVMALNVIKSSGADYVKISNALTGKKALVEDVQFVRGILGDTVAIKIDGGISDAKTVRELMKAGASRFGCSKSVKIIKG
jgi:deoxyribose-phosphate aldolase